jgi:hypothetical protein
MTSTLITLGFLSTFALFICVWIATAKVCRELSDEVRELRSKVADYNARYVQPKDEFYFKWQRTPVGDDEEFEIIQWCRDNSVRFNYHLEENGYSRADFSVWITDPDTAMIFKLTWGGK